MWGKTITLTSGSQAYQLAERMASVDALGAPKTAHALEIQLGLDAGAARIYLGDSPAVTNTGGWFTTLIADQAWAPPRLPNWLDLEKIYLYSDTAGVQLGVFAS